MPNDLLRLSAPFDLHYRDIELYGAGAQAEVYSAWYTQFRQPVRVAIKVLNPAGCVGGSFEKLREKFLVEAEVLCGVTHPHVVRVFQVVEAELRNEPTVGFTMEWLPSTFAHELRRHPGGLPSADLGRHLEQALLGLGALHDAGVAVRDLRPANLLLSEQGQLKLADLGMARTESVALSIREQSTKFQAPEILDGSLRLAYRQERQDPPASAYFASDLYSLGLIFYEAAVGADRWRQLPALSAVYGSDGPGSGLAEDRRWEAWHANRSLELPPVCTVCRGMPAALGAAIDGMVRKDPCQRLGRVVDVLAALGGAGARAPEPAVVNAPPASVQESERAHDPGWWTRHKRTVRRATMAVVGVLALAMALVAGGRLLWPRTAKHPVVSDRIASPEVSAATPGSLKRGRDAIDRAIAAAGGAAKLAGLKAYTEKSVIDATMQGMALRFTTEKTVSYPDKVHTLQETPFGSMTTIVAGDVGWQQSPAGNMDMSADDLAEAREGLRTDMLGVLREPGAFTFQALAPREIEGKACLPVYVTGVGEEYFIIYFGDKDGLPVMVQQPGTSPVSEAPGTLKTYLDEYQAFQGIMMPSRKRLFFDDEEVAKIRTEAFTANPSIEPAMFAKKSVTLEALPAVPTRGPAETNAGIRSSSTDEAYCSSTLGLRLREIGSDDRHEFRIPPDVEGVLVVDARALGHMGFARGDVITKIDQDGGYLDGTGTSIRNMTELRLALEKCPRGRPFMFELWKHRGGKTFRSGMWRQN